MPSSKKNSDLPTTDDILGRWLELSPDERNGVLIALHRLVVAAEARDFKREFGITPKQARATYGKAAHA